MLQWKDDNIDESTKSTIEFYNILCSHKDIIQLTNISRQIRSIKFSNHLLHLKEMPEKLQQ